MRILLAVALTAVLGNSSWAIQNIKLGNLNINPYVYDEGRYDDNIYLTQSDKKSSFINKGTVGVGFAQTIQERMDLKADYHLEALTYKKQPSVNDAIHHMGMLGLKMKLPKSMTLGAADSYEATTDQATSQLTDRSKRVKNTGSLSFNAPIKGQFGFGVDGQHVFNDYLSAANNTLDRSEMLVGGNVNYKLQPKTQLFVGYHYGDLKYRKADASTAVKGDAAYHNIDAGITGKIFNKITGAVKANTQFRKQKYAIADTKTNTQTIGYGIQLKYVPEETMDIALSGNRSAVETTSAQNRFYRATSGDIGVSKRIQKFELGVGGNYEHIAYPEQASYSKKRIE